MVTFTIYFFKASGIRKDTSIDVELSSFINKSNFYYINSGIYKPFKYTY